MRDPAISRLSLSACALAAVSLCVLPSNAHAFLGLFEKKQKEAPGTDERQAQEAQATALLMAARQDQNDGKSGRAQSQYLAIVKQFPFTTAASEAAYASALITRANSDVTTAFDAFQKFINDYRSSPRFNDALQQQYELAEEARGGRRQRAMLILPVKMGGEDVIKLYQQIIKNAPFGNLAPLAQFSIAEIYQDLGEKDRSVLAYQTVAENYPNTKQASEAQFRIGSISSVAASRSEDKSNLVATRDALTTYMTTNPKGDRAGEAEVILQQVNAAEATQSLSVGKFYQRMGKTKAAAIYFNEALKYGSPEASNEARELLAQLAAADPEAVADAKKGQPDQDYTVPGARNLKTRDDYIGPLSPELTRLGQKPKMRTGDDNFLPIPIQEPTLPLTPGMAPTGGSLLPPVQEEKPALLPVPEAPGIPPQLPVPPKPTPAP
ncbi:outer membrane protein assembly factor BamD (BamD/ComL family) [Prosthecobacter fusiformis]|uniref:Outer membrane protein assembly factor BamD (BamD/ComL family) n=1 Tax=Prosthecobacter fusiformis TaxID=48464 RepID=A0A4R7RKF6_9BACT|nr:tetratricopeptide repeat protein [Prosthecobacter fusiformis]TDU64658.1 outer membrane protein assembly factor BamD (BamD/ComL family) [Prosthecobacter fusiformis]